MPHYLLKSLVETFRLAFIYRKPEVQLTTSYLRNRGRKQGYILQAVVLATACQAAFGLAPGESRSISNTTKPLAEQRYHYEMAKGALTRGDVDEYEKHYALLGDYPLVPYLDYTSIKQSLNRFDFKAVNQFFATNKGTFLEYRLREQLLHALAKKKRWSDFLTYYQPNIRSKVLRCSHLLSRIETGDTKAYDEVAGIWTEGKSQPKACDPLFSRWRKHGGLTDDIAWVRFNNAMKRNKRSLARYVTGLMSSKQKAYAEELLGVHAYPARIKQHRRFSEQSEHMQDIIAHGIKRFARIDPIKALYHWERYEAQQLFPKHISTETKIYLVKRLTSHGFTEKAEQLINNSHELRERGVVERLIREALRNQKYDKVYQWISYLDQEAQDSNRWRYWRARAQDELGVQHEEENSTQIYKELSKTRSFYGFLSADILNRDYTLEDYPSVVSPSTRNVVENMPATRRARELWLRGNYSEAQAEWQFATRKMEPNELAAAGYIARQWGWYNKGIHAMIRGNLWDDLEIRFPLAYKATVEKAASETEIEKTFLYAIARQESAFSEKARSSAGAMGLMQLMPGTARQTARKSGIEHRDSYLFDPEYNIDLGSRYLNELLGKYNGNRILAAAAYNAGPHRVKKWIERTPLDLPFDVWIESIPFKETRGYVQNVLAFSVIYAYRLGQEHSLVNDIEINGSL